MLTTVRRLQKTCRTSQILSVESRMILGVFVLTFGGVHDIKNVCAEFLFGFCRSEGPCKLLVVIF